MPSKELSGKYVLIILAAGRSARLGSPKQLLSYQGKNLLQHTIDAAHESQIGPIIVILGSDMEEIASRLDPVPLTIVKNPNWESGMASSVVCGINTINNLYPDTESAILMVCDQPFVNAKLLKNLIKKQEESGSFIVASSYENIHGTPALFHKNHFDELSELKGDTGARSLIKKYTESIETIPFDHGSIDIDTIEDYRNLVK
ncbi:nucleotidyltransferase family protein [Daejeonella sp.]|uniref:nucleotidyltransferase family protein n=1 Tax=Daejeonella sp. TaxID=2805397 RepID=UPI00272F4A36|nr:nucleotidyltransferase family protein [Daejeonella sp.]MDP2414784.1 nucleotidyltransferase family protein [Daejeonella sp.]